MNVPGFLLSTARSLSVMALIGFTFVAWQPTGMANDLDGGGAASIFCLGFFCDDGCSARVPVRWGSSWACKPFGTGCDEGYICSCWCAPQDSGAGPPEACKCE